MLAASPPESMPSLPTDPELSPADQESSEAQESLIPGLSAQPLQVDVSTCQDAATALDWLAVQLPQWPGLRPAMAVQIIAGTLKWQPEQLTRLVALIGELGFEFHALATLHPDARHQARKLSLPVVAPLSGTVITPVAKSAAPAATVSTDPATLPTRVVHHNLRSGQSVTSPGHLLVIGDVNAGAEVVAAGDITVWGELKGIAHAGSQGDTHAEVRALRLDALQLRIAHAIARRPDHWVEHTQADRLTRGGAEGFYQPEVARIEQDEIRIFPHR